MALILVSVIKQDREILKFRKSQKIEIASNIWEFYLSFLRVRATKNNIAKSTEQQN